MPFTFPKLYPILDSSFIPRINRAEFLKRLAGGLAEAGLTLLEYRHKTGSDDEIVADADILRAVLAAPTIKLILDDRVDLVDQTGFDGVHVDAGDLPPAEARRLLGPERIVGTFGGSEEFLPGILDAPADYLAIGPAYTTTTKQTARAPIGPEGVRKMRAMAGPDRILTTAGGITLATAPLLLAAGATSVAVASALFNTPDPVAVFRRWMAELE